jgi:hypothetical protein
MAACSNCAPLGWLETSKHFELHLFLNSIRGVLEIGYSLVVTAQNFSGGGLAWHSPAGRTVMLENEKSGSAIAGK